MTIEQIYDALRALQLFVFAGLGLAALATWFKRRTPAAAWLAATFGSLALVVVISEFAPDEPEGVVGSAFEKVSIAVIVLFPYLLYRFSLSFIDRSRWFDALAMALTVGTLIGAFTITFPPEDAPRTTTVQLYIYLILIQWAVLAGRVAMGLWRAGRDQPTVTRRRMRVMSLGSLSLVIALVIAGLARPEDDIGVQQLVLELFAIASPPLFLLGFAPPRLVRLAWATPERERFRAAEFELLKAETLGEVAEIFLPHVTHLVGGRGSVLVGHDGTVLGADGLDEEEVAATARGDDPSSVTEALESGRLVVIPSRYTPFFGDEEMGILRGLAGIADLALARAELLERERSISAELKAANEVMRDFVAIASHDLRTPITVIQGFLIALEQRWDDVADNEKREYMTIMRRQSEHLTRLVNDLLTVSRIDANAIETHKEAVELRRAIEDALEGLEGDIKVEAAPGLTVHADPHHVNRILRNYVGNALTYGRPPVVIEATPTSRFVELRVRDYGEGIEDGFVDRLFEKFARSERSAGEGAGGTGLGLSIVRGLAKANGGEAWYEPNEPTGSCFAIRLPRTDT